MVEDPGAHKAAAEPYDTSEKWKVARRWSVIGLVFIAALSLIGLIIAWSGHPASDTLRYEFAKTCMQVLAVAFFGGLAAIATSNFQHTRTQEADYLRQQAANERDNARTEAEASDRRLEQRRRDVDKARVERRRQDDQLRSVMQETLTAYNRVKRIRRLLEAETNDEAAGHLTLAVYDKHMDGLIDEQLAFERLKRLTPFIDDERLSVPPAREAGATSEALMSSQTLTNFYADIEDYLNDVIDEYRKKRYTVAAADSGVPMAEFGALSAFIHKEDFVPGAANKMDEIIKALQTALCQPPDDYLLVNTPALKDGQSGG